MDYNTRDGEQPWVPFAVKTTIAQLLLEELNIDRIEIASASCGAWRRISYVKGIMVFGPKKGYTKPHRSFNLCYGGLSYWMDVGAKVRTYTQRLINEIIWNTSSKKTPEQHLKEIAQTIALYKENNIATNVYLEDWSNGCATQSEYVFSVLDSSNTRWNAFYLDTLESICRHL
jgi:D-citramalate synthase